GRMAERSYARLSTTFNHTFTRKPIVLYANAADFQQTTTSGEIIGEGTGGFTDEFMNRVVLPLTGDYAENDHVLGHELVHVFQYDIASANNNNRRRFNLEQLPLWLVEGMAEYFSKGRIDPLTSMWIRDATIHNRLPDLRKLTRDPRYFPYRYGEALLAYIGGRFGDEAVVRYFLAAGLIGIEPAFDRVLGISAKQLFTDWQESSRELYNPVVATRQMTLGRPLLGKKTTRGDLNIGPAISPDGRYVAFLSTRELFDIDLFLADAQTGQVIRRLISADRDAHYDALRFIDSGGTWSPDSKRIAFVVYEKGDNYIGIVDTARVRTLPLFANSKNINPQYAPDGHSLYFIGNPEGVPDIYRYYFSDNHIERVTAVQTGVAGITEMSPALTVAARTGDLVFSLYEDDDYNIYNLPASTPGTAVAPVAGTEAPRAAILPPLRGTGSQNTWYLSHPEEGLMTSTASFTERGYSPNLHVAYIGPPTVGVGADQFGFGVNGSISAYFTDILGQHNVGFTVEGGGSGYVGLSIADQIGAEVF